VIHHTLFEDGTITKYDVKFGNRTIKNIPTEMLEVVKAQEHMHSSTEKEEDEENDD
jgi:phage baseplate assembly protein gpV